MLHDEYRRRTGHSYFKESNIKIPVMYVSFSKLIVYLLFVFVCFLSMQYIHLSIFRNAGGKDKCSWTKHTINVPTSQEVHAIRLCNAYWVGQVSLSMISNI